MLSFFIPKNIFFVIHFPQNLGVGNFVFPTDFQHFFVHISKTSMQFLSVCVIVQISAACSSIP